VHSAWRHKAIKKDRWAFGRLTLIQITENNLVLLDRKKAFVFTTAQNYWSSLWICCMLTFKTTNSNYYFWTNSSFWILRLGCKECIYLPSNCKQLTRAFLLTRWWHSPKIFVVQYFCNKRSIHFNYKIFQTLVTNK
jgi:hypothetical protein